MTLWVPAASRSHDVSMAPLAAHTVVPFGRLISCTAKRLPEVSTTRTRIRSTAAPVNVKQSSSPTGVIAALVGVDAPIVIATQADARDSAGASTSHSSTTDRASAPRIARCPTATPPFARIRALSFTIRTSDPNHRPLLRSRRGMEHSAAC